MPESQPSKPRWYRLTPDRLLIALLPIEGFLFLSERFRWFAFNEHKGWTVLIAVAVVCLAVVLLMLWFGVSLVLRRRFQFSIRSLLLFVVVVAVVCSWFTVKVQQARGQREVVEAFEKVGFVMYDYEVAELDANGRRPPAPGPPWLRNLVGVDFLSDVVALRYKRATDAGLVHLKGLTSLQELVLDNTQVTDAGLVHLEGLTGLRHLDLTNTEVTDAGLVHLKGLTNVQWLFLYRTQVTEAGVQDLQKALPNCEIRR